MSTKHFNIFNTGESSFFTPGVQLANIARVKPDAPAIVYINSENKESVMTWHSLEVLSNRIAWYLLEQGIKPGKSVIVALPNIPTHIALAFGIWKAGGCYVPVLSLIHIYLRYFTLGSLISRNNSSVPSVEASSTTSTSIF